MLEVRKNQPDHDWILNKVLGVAKELENHCEEMVGDTEGLLNISFSFEISRERPVTLLVKRQYIGEFRFSRFRA